MTTIDFYFNAQDRFQVACRLAGKALAQKKRLLIYAPEAEAKLKRFEADAKFQNFTTMMVKTHLSLSADPTLKGVPKGWTLPIRDILIYGFKRSFYPGTYLEKRAYVREVIDFTAHTLGS